MVTIQIARGNLEEFLRQRALQDGELFIDAGNYEPDEIESEKENYSDDKDTDCKREFRCLSQ